jgi:hypothetical protein
MFKVEPIQAAEQQNRHFILHLIQTQGKGRTIDEIKSSSKQVVKAPTTYIELIQQLEFFPAYATSSSVNTAQPLAA